MALIFVTGNYTYFNILTVIVLLWLLDDKFYAFIGLGNKKAGFYQKFLTISPKTFTLTLIFSLFVVPLSLKQTVDAFRLDIQWPQILTKVERVLAPFRSINSYGLFQVITTERREIVIEGSHHPDDESSWQAYEFPYKPGGNLKGGLAWVQPHQPRLDWQMWFAALSTPDRNQWYSQMLIRLLHGQPEVLKLFAHNPFPDKAPQYLRASLYRYDFTSPAEKAASGNYWKRERLGPYHQPIYLLPPKKKP